jgi:dolichol-phosphate mannosyltransferase
VRAVIVLPTYNERENIAAYLQSLRHITSSVDVLVVDDNSPDGTGELARSLGATHGGVTVLDRSSKEGLGSAYRAGFERVLDEGYDVVISMDADLSHDPAVIPEMLELIRSGADAVIGSRYVTGGGTTDWPVHRQLLSKWGNAYTRRILGLPTRDCTSGYRAYRSSALAAIEPGSTSAEGYAFLTELVRRLGSHGFAIAETPIIFRDRTRGKSKMSGAIIVESMLLVTRWGLTDRLRRLRPFARRSRS